MKTISIFVLISLFAISAMAQRISDLPQNKAAKQVRPVQTTQSVQTASQDSIIFDKLEHDYGTMEFGDDGNTVFTFTNKGKAPVVLSNVRASCGCTTPEWTKTPVGPGEKGEIKVKYNTNLPGTFNKSITVTSNAANSTVMLRIKGQVMAKPQ
jgi:hypothetical protein